MRIHGLYARSAKLALASVLVSALSYCEAASVQVGTLVPVDTIDGAIFFDPGFGSLHGGDQLLTREVAGAPVNIISDFSGTSADADGTVEPGDDINLNIFSLNVNIGTLGRFAGTDSAGGVRWAIDLTPLDAYLSDNSLSLDSLELRYGANFTDPNSTGDIFLSYTNPAESITLTELDLTSADIASTWIVPALGAAPGAIVNGTHQVIALDASDSSSSPIDVLPLFEAGVRELNLVFAADGFWGGGDTLQIFVDDSGVFIETSPAVAVPEPTGLVLAGLMVAAAAASRVRVAG